MERCTLLGCSDARAGSDARQQRWDSGSYLCCQLLQAWARARVIWIGSAGASAQLRRQRRFATG